MFNMERDCCVFFFETETVAFMIKNKDLAFRLWLLQRSQVFFLVSLYSSDITVFKIEEKKQKIENATVSRQKKMQQYYWFIDLDFSEKSFQIETCSTSARRVSTTPRHFLNWNFFFCQRTGTTPTHFLNWL